MNRHTLIILRRAALVLWVVAGLWSAWLALGGFVSITIGPIHASSRDTRNPLLIAGIGAVAFGLLTWRLGDGAGLAAKWLWLRPRLGAWTRQVTRAVWWSIGLLPVFVAVAGATVDTYQWTRAAPVWLDEEMIAINVRDRSFMDLAGALWLGQSAPYGWLVTERAAILGLGTGELPLRAVPLIFGIATLALAVWIGRRWLTGIGGTVLVLLCWISSSFAHYRFEVKHYTADIFFALLLPVLAVWATEAAERTDRRRRAFIWWGIAAVGQWFANGALFVTPACAICLLLLIWRRDGKQDAIRFAGVGLVWLASFGLHYHVAMRYTNQSAVPSDVLAERAAARVSGRGGDRTMARQSCQATCRESGRHPIVRQPVGFGDRWFRIGPQATRCRPRHNPALCVCLRRCRRSSPLSAILALDCSGALSWFHARARSRLAIDPRCGRPEAICIACSRPQRRRRRDPSDLRHRETRPHRSSDQLSRPQLAVSQRP